MLGLYWFLTWIDPRLVICVPAFATPNRDSRAFLEALAAMEPRPAALYDAAGHWPSPIASASHSAPSRPYSTWSLLAT